VGRSPRLAGQSGIPFDFSGSWFLDAGRSDSTSSLLRRLPRGSGSRRFVTESETRVEFHATPWALTWETSSPKGMHRIHLFLDDKWHPVVCAGSGSASGAVEPVLPVRASQNSKNGDITIQTRLLSPGEVREWKELNDKSPSGDATPPPATTIHELLSRIDNDRSRASHLMTVVNRDGESVAVAHRFLQREENADERLAAEVIERKHDEEKRKLEEELRKRAEEAESPEKGEEGIGAGLRKGGILREDLETLLKAAAKDYYGDDADIELVGEQAILKRGSKYTEEAAQRQRRQKARAFFGDVAIFLALVVAAAWVGAIPNLNKAEAMTVMAAGWLLYAILSKMDCITHRGETARDRLDRLVDEGTDDDAATAQMLAEAAALALRTSKLGKNPTTSSSAAAFSDASSLRQRKPRKSDVQ